MKDFDRWYAVYPRKVAKGDARKAWQQTAAIRPSTDSMIEAVQAQCKSEQWQRDGGHYICYPASWLRAERWDDVVAIELPKPARARSVYDVAEEDYQRKYGALYAAK